MTLVKSLTRVKSQGNVFSVFVSQPHKQSAVRSRNPVDICSINSALESQKEEPGDVRDTFQGKAERKMIRLNELLDQGSTEASLCLVWTQHSLTI